MIMAATTEFLPQGLHFIGGGMYPLSTELWQDVNITVQYDAFVSRIGLTPRYLNDNFYLTSYITRVNGIYRFKIDSFMRGETLNYADVRLDSLTFPVTINCEINGSYFVFSVNGTAVSKFEFLSIPNGNIMIDAGTGDICTNATIIEPQATGWTTNAGTNGVVVKQTEESDETQQFTLIGTATQQATLSKTVSLTGSVTLSFTAIGTGTVTYSGVTKTLSGNNKYSFPFTVTGTQNVTVIFKTNSRLTIQEPQIEEGTYATSYIPNESTTDVFVREESILSFPASSNFRTNQGAIYMSVTANTVMTSFTLFETDTNEFKLSYASGNLTWTVLGHNVVLPVSFTAPQQIICTWQGKKLTVSANGNSKSASITLGVVKTPKSLQFTRTQEVGYITIDELAIWSYPIEETIIDGDLPSPDSILMQASFQKAISGKGVSWLELPVAPFDASPILVEKADGSAMKKVSFFDLETAQYRTYNEELFVYDGESDYVEVAFDNLNEDFFDLMLRTEEGEKIGGPYTIDGKRIWFNLAPTEKDIHNRQPLYIRYQINDSYTVDYNISATDGYRVDFAKHDGQEKTIYQEGNRYAEPYKLADMIEMNPIHNQNNEGFLYVTQNVHEISSFKVTVTPEDVPADGGSMSMILVEPVDKDGNFVPVANLTVDAQYGSIHRVATSEAAEAQKRSGMYIYQYYPPFISRATNTRNVVEKIWILDNDTEMGMQYTFLIRPMSKQHPVPFTDDRALVEENRTKVFNYLIMYEGMDETEDSTLFSILDLNKDSKLTYEDIDTLESGSIDSTGIANLVTRLKDWEDSQ
jgi:hypothetical protein